MNDILEFEKGIAMIDNETLSQSIKYEMAKGGLPKSRPVEHFQLLNEIEEMASKIDGGVIVKPKPIYVAEKSTLRMMWDGPKEECPIDKYLIQRLTTSLDIVSQSDNGISMSIALSYNEKGISLAFGPKVFACSNMNIFGDNLMRTYGGQDKIPFDKMLQLMSGFMNNFHEKRANDFAIIDKMKSIDVGQDAIHTMYGKLIQQAVKQNMDGKTNAPLNQTQVADFIRNSYEAEYMDPKTAWDLNQIGTSVLKPQNTDMIILNDNIKNFNNFICDEFEVLGNEFEVGLN